MKKSIAEAMQRAQQISVDHEGLVVRVLNKKRKRAVVNTSEWVYVERIRDGYMTVAVFINGKEK